MMCYSVKRVNNSAMQTGLSRILFLSQWTFNLLDEILKEFETGKKYYHILTEHRKLSKIAKFGCEMF